MKIPRSKTFQFCYIRKLILFCVFAVKTVIFLKNKRTKKFNSEQAKAVCVLNKDTIQNNKKQNKKETRRKQVFPLSPADSPLRA